VRGSTMKTQTSGIDSFKLNRSNAINLVTEVTTRTYFMNRSMTTWTYMCSNIRWRHISIGMQPKQTSNISSILSSKRLVGSTCRRKTESYYTLWTFMATKLKLILWPVCPRRSHTRLSSGLGKMQNTNIPSLVEVSGGRPNIKQHSTENYDDSTKSIVGTWRRRPSSPFQPIELHCSVLRRIFVIRRLCALVNSFMRSMLLRYLYRSFRFFSQKVASCPTHFSNYSTKVCFIQAYNLFSIFFSATPFFAFCFMAMRFSCA
jgi:hypothetical protein